MRRLFGTDGIRGVAGEFPLDPATVEKIGRALALSLATAAGRPPCIVIGRDTRESGASIETDLIRGVEAEGGRADRAGVLTTPAVASVARLRGYDAGVVISASHNPYRDNGIKVFSGRGQKLPDTLEAAIEHRVLDARDVHDDGSHGLAWRCDPAGAPPPAATPGSLRQTYVDWLMNAAGGQTTLHGARIVLDCANGAASSIAPEIFRRLQADTLTIAASPDGRNINEGCGALYPESLAAEVVRRGATLGLAFDGDADRCLAVDASGRVLDGDYILYLVASDLKRSGRLEGDMVVGTVMSNLWLERALHAEGIRILRAPVGDKYVLEEMQRGGVILGGEQSGHIIFLDRSTTGDGLLTGIVLADLVRRTGIDLASWAASVRPCPQVLINVPVRSRPPLESHPRIGAAIRDEEARLVGHGRLLVRYSGTEPKARIMVEGEPRAAVEECAARLRRIIQQEIGLEST
jgi:phosphoglucosamine mutase